jgi:hypothetical protein
MKINTTSILVALLATTSATLAASCPDPTVQPRNGIFNRLKFYAENLYPNGYQSCASSLDNDANAAYMAQQQQQQAAHYGDDTLRVPMMKAEAGKGSRDSKMVVLGVVGAAGVFALGML